MSVLSRWVVYHSGLSEAGPGSRVALGPEGRGRVRNPSVVKLSVNKKFIYETRSESLTSHFDLSARPPGGGGLSVVTLETPGFCEGSCYGLYGGRADEEDRTVDANRRLLFLRD